MNIVVGVHEQYQGTVDVTTPKETLQRYPNTAATREFNAGVISPRNLTPKISMLCSKAWAEDLVTVLSFKLSVKEVFNGTWKPYVQSMAGWVKDTGQTSKMIFCLWHEPENDVGDPNGFKDAEEFNRYFDTVHDWIKAINPDLLTMHAAVGYRYANKNKGTKANPKMVPVDIDDARAKVWGQNKADIKAIDIYSGRSFPLGTILPELSGFKRWHTYTANGGLYAVTERGFMADTGPEFAVRAATIKEEAEWLRADPVGQKCMLYITWLTRGTEGDDTLKPDPLMTDAVNYLHNRVYEVDVPVEPETPTQLETIVCPLCNGAASVAAGETYTIVKVAGVRSD